MSDFPEPQLIDVGEVTLSVHDAGDGPAVVLSHGFPELGRSWIHQFGPLVDAGFRVIAPDQRGYGGSDVPENVEDYDIVHLTGDLIGLLDALKIEKAVFIGHDWGGFVAWAMPVLHPDRCLGAGGINTPYTTLPSTELMKATFPDPESFYILWFQELEIPEKFLDPRARMVFEKFMRRVPDSITSDALPEANAGGVRIANPFLSLDTLEPKGEPLLDEADRDKYATAFERTGFFGPISWYRNADRNLSIAPELGQKELHLPTLQVVTDMDPAIPKEGAEITKSKCSDVEVHLIEQCGHWTQYEKPEELSKIMVDWLSSRFL